MGCTGSKEMTDEQMKPQQYAAQQPYGGYQQPPQPPMTYQQQQQMPQQTLDPYASAQPYNPPAAYNPAAPAMSASSVPYSQYAAPTGGTRVGNVSQQDAETQSKIVTVGIDFGTARSGYAFALGSDPVVQLQFSWPGELIQQAKTLTALLYDTTTWRAIAWGMEAYKQYRAVAPKDLDKYAYLEGFKLLLSESQEADFVEPLPAGCPHSRQAVIGHYLSFLKDYLHEQLRRTYGQKFTTQYTLKYCFTIPAGWSEEAKFLMRQAATLAGIIGHQDSHDMSLIYEPEAAALTACSQANVSVEVGEVFLIVDAGGGTVDFTMHVVESQAGRKVLSEATYRACLLQGSKKLDQNFEDFVADLVGEDLYEAWCQSHPGDHLQLVSNEWEQLKKNFQGSSSLGASVMQLPFSLVKAMPQQVHTQLVDRSGYEDKLRLTDAEVAGIFDLAVNNILEVVDQMVQRAGVRPDRLLLVGGFGSSAYLQLKMENKFGNSMGDLIYPPFGYAAVVEGAVRHLQQPSTIHKRVSNMTYGVRVFLNWTRDMPESYKQWDTYYKAYVTDKAFLVAVKKGEPVEVSHEFRHRVTPSHASAIKQEVRVELYSSDQTNPSYVDDRMELVETIVLPLDMTRVVHEDAYHIDLSFKFGSAEIEVTATDTIENRAIKRRLEFTAHTSAKGGVMLG